MKKLDERGQTLVEYALLATACVLVLVGATIGVLDAASDFYRDLARIICLPLP
ncbi:MAG: Flp family type IVb pilin [Planctomycetota bacterium]